MLDDFTDLEAELKRLRPRQIPSRLFEGIEQELQRPSSSRPAYTSATTWRSWKWAIWPVAAAMVGVGAFVVFKQANPSLRQSASAQAAVPPTSALLSPAVPADVYKPVRADNLLAAQEEERVTLPDGTLARRLRAQYVDTITWRNPRTNASLRWSVPREEVRIIPVSLQ